MSNLVDKFFREDLAEEEKKALREELASSEESALRFGEKAEQAYRLFGLPEPEWTGPDNLPCADLSNYAPWVSVFALFAIIAGFSVFLHKEFRDSAKGSPAIQEPSKEINILDSASSAPDPGVEDREISYAYNRSTTPPNIIPTKTNPVSTFSTSNNLPMLPSPMPEFTPVNLDQNPSQNYSSLSIHLRLSAPRSLAVHVLDIQKNELVSLFKGTLGNGTWIFEWNGRLRDGHLAPPGTYKIEVKAGAWSQTKVIIIPQ